MKKYHDIQELKFIGDKLQIKIDGKTHTFQLSEISEKLKEASRIERERYEISPAGYGIHWPLIDEDISIDGLLGIRHNPSKRRKVS
jgi:hypothetical protein